jgi:Uma2 family endonuclease
VRAVIADFPRHWLEERKRSGAHRYDEFWDGVLHVPPPRHGNHSDLVADLAAFLDRSWAKPRGGDVLHGANVTTPDDAANWLHNFRIADVVLLDRDRLHFDRTECVVGAPLVAVMVRAPRDETYEKFPFYAKLGVPEVWVFDRDTRAPEVYALAAGPAYQSVAAGADGWVVSSAAGVAFRHAGGAKVAVRVGSGAAVELPDA